MRGPDAFRRKLAHHLTGMAVARWHACAGHPSGDDLKTMARCRQLAASAESLDQRSCSEVDALLADPACARRFAELWRTLPDALGVTVWPHSAHDLVVWLVHHADHDQTISRRDRAAGGVPRPRAAPTGSATAGWWHWMAAPHRR